MCSILIIKRYKYTFTIYNSNCHTIFYNIQMHLKAQIKNYKTKFEKSLSWYIM